MNCLILSLFFFTVFGTNFSIDFNSQLEWVNDLNMAKKLAQQKGKPIFLLLYKPWCSICKIFSRELFDSDYLVELSKKFVMVKIQEDINEEEFAPDGTYVPRILFLSKDGKVMKDIYNEKGSKSYLYYYVTQKQILSSMHLAIDSA